jgi:exosome complex RNA-binding protein Rrp42 (RNase PH superfamily)
MQKGGERPFKKEEILKAIDLAQEKTNELFKYIP